MNVRALFVMLLLWAITAVLSVVIIESWLMYKPVSVSITIKGNQRDICKIYYASEKGFNEKETIEQKSGLPNRFKRFEFHLPTGKISALRIDPGQNSRRYEIGEISVTVGKSKTSWKKEGILKYFSLQNLAVPDSIQSPNLILYTVDNPDGRLVLDHGFFSQFPTVSQEGARRWYLFLGMIHLVAFFVILLFHRRLAAFPSRVTKLLKDEERLQRTTERVKAFFHQNLAIIIISFLLAIFSYGYELFNFTLNIDDEAASFYSASETISHLLTGRWGSYFLNFFLSPHAVLPYFPILITLCSLAIVAILFTTSEKFPLSASIIFSIIFVTHPLHSYYLAFNTPFFGIGMVLATLAYLCMKLSNQHPAHRYSLLVLAALLLTSALSLYQAMMSVFLVLSAYFVFNQFFMNKAVWKQTMLSAVLPVVAVSITGFIFFKAGELTARYLILVDIPADSFDYIDNMAHYDALPFYVIIKNLKNHMTDFIFGSGGYGSQVGFAQHSVFLMFLFVTIRIFLTKTIGITRKLVAVILLTAIVFSAFSVSIAVGNPMPPRTYMAIPLMVALLWWLVSGYSGRLLRISLLIVALIILVNNTYINTRLFYASYVSWQADRDLAIRVLDRVEQLNPPFIDGKINVAFTGPHQYEQNELFFSSDTHGASFFEWGKGRTKRIESLYKTMGINHLSVISIKNISNCSDTILKMPFWPIAGSVRLCDSVVVVNFSNGN